MRVRKKKMEERRIEFEIKKNIGVLCESGSVRKELNVVSWNNAEPVLDLRNWERRNGVVKALKGMTLSTAEATTLAILLNDFLDGNKPASEETTEKFTVSSEARMLKKMLLKIKNLYYTEGEK